MNSLKAITFQWYRQINQKKIAKMIGVKAMEDIQLEFEFEPNTDTDEVEDDFELFAYEFSRLPVVDEIAGFELRDISKLNKNRIHNRKWRSEISDTFPERFDSIASGAAYKSQYLKNSILSKEKMLDIIRYEFATEKDMELQDKSLEKKYCNYLKAMVEENIEFLEQAYKSWGFNYGDYLTKSMFITFIDRCYTNLEIKFWKKLLNKKNKGE